MEVYNHEHDQQCSGFETAPFADPELGVGGLPIHPTLQGSCAWSDGGPGGRVPDLLQR